MDKKETTAAAELYTQRDEKHPENTSRFFDFATAPNVAPSEHKLHTHGRRKKRNRDTKRLHLVGDQSKAFQYKEQQELCFASVLYAATKIASSLVR